MTKQTSKISTQAQQKLEGYNQELLLLNNITKLLLQHLDEENLFNNICSCLTDCGRYTSARIVNRPEQYLAEEAGTLHTLNENPDYDQTTNTDRQDSKQFASRLAQLMPDCDTVVINDVEAATTFNTLLKNTDDFRTKSLIVLPIQIKETVVASLVICCDYNGAFDEHRIAVLRGIAGNLSLAVSNIRIRKEQDQFKNNLKIIFDQTQIGYMILDKSLKIVSFNQKIISIFRPDLEQEFCENEEFVTFFLPDKRQFLTPILKNVISSGDSYQYELQRAKSNLYRVELDCVRSEGQITGACLSIYDITESKNRGQKKQKLVDELMKNNNEFKKFSQILSHHVRAPLCSILALTTLISELTEDEEKAMLLESLSRSARKLDDILKELNMMLGTKNSVVEIGSVNLCDLTEEVKRMLPAPGEGIKPPIIEYDFSAAPEIRTSRSFLINIFYILLSNGLKFARPGRHPHLKIRLYFKDDNIQISFADNGIGIDLAKHGKQLFTLNKRFHSDVDGFGIGLYLIKSQISRLGGSIQVKSIKGEGSEFIISLNTTANNYL